MANKKDLRVSLGEDLLLKIKDLKNYYGIKNTSEIIRLLITEKHREIQFRQKGE